MVASLLAGFSKTVYATVALIGAMAWWVFAHLFVHFGGIAHAAGSGNGHYELINHGRVVAVPFKVYRLMAIAQVVGNVGLTMCFMALVAYAIVTKARGTPRGSRGVHFMNAALFVIFLVEAVMVLVLRLVA